MSEKKFKRLADRLAEREIPSLRFDFTGCGLSDGDFRFTTVKNMTKDLVEAFKVFRNKTQITELVLVAHSLAGCVVANSIKKINPQKIVLISPALNQKDLLRYYFSLKKAKNHGNLKLTWENYNDFFDEAEFEKDCCKSGKMTNENYIDKEYFLENKETDYSSFFKGCEDKVLHIHGDKDDKVPLESVNINFPNKIIIENGDHDLEKPNRINKWLDQVIRFILRPCSSA
ncbi:MAG: alpha/beta hydrolase [Patescibacteria group bacterium]|nr:alpha/beta hydrolase [Patescibacteria group bacterium]